jgi:transcriptional regulator with XRE-family HTH domain
LTASGRQLKAAREDRGWTQADVGEKLGVSQYTVSGIEHRAVIPRRHVSRLDKIFGGAGWRAPVKGGATLVLDAPAGGPFILDELARLRGTLDSLRKRVEALERGHRTRKPVR